MMLKTCLALLIVAAYVSAASRDRNQKPYRVVCYLGSWANYRTGDGKFLIEDIDPKLCTHLIYGFAKLQNNQIAAYDPYLDLKENFGLGAFQRFNDLRKQNPQLSTLIAIGGWNEGSTKYSQMAANPASRATFVQSAVDFLQKYDFDGLDLDWEYPANRGGAAADKQNFVTLCKELKEAFAGKYLLTAAVAAGKWTIEPAYDIPGMNKYLDFINVMVYDLHGSWESFTGHHTSLYSRPEEQEGHKILNVDFAMNYWHQKGADKKKLVMGMGSYGRSFTLGNPASNGLGASTAGPGSAGPMTKEPGMLGYNEICLNLKQGWTEVFAPKVEAPYAYSGNQWVGYDNIKSIGIKVDYLMKEGFGGGMIWSLETDDFRGKCGDGKYPLLTTIYAKLNGGVIPPEPQTNQPEPQTRPTEPTSQPRTPPPTSNPGEDFECTVAGLFRDPKDCSVYHECVANNGGFTHYTRNCGDNLAFDETISNCNYRENVPGC